MKLRSQQRYKNFFYSLLLLAASLIVATLIGEVMLRLLGHRGVPVSYIGNTHMVHDSILDWRYVPNSQRREGHVTYTYNNSGFRDVEHTIKKKSGVTRIAVVGDSVTEGSGVDWKSVFSHVVQSKLGDKFEIITIAMGGLNTPQEVHLFEQEGTVYEPELVILNFVLNDGDFFSTLKGAQLHKAEKDSEIGLLNIKVNPKLKRLLKSSALIYFVKERLENLKGIMAGANEGDYVETIWKKDENRRKTIRAFAKLRALQDQYAFDVVVIIWPVITDYNGYRYRSIHNWVNEEAEKKGFATIDLLPYFAKIPYRKLQLTSADNFHPNALGHKIGASAFLEWHK